MADYVTEKEAEASAKSLVAAGTVIEAYSCRDHNGAPAVRVLRKVSATGFDSTEGGQSKAGNWATITAEANA